MTTIAELAKETGFSVENIIKTCLTFGAFENINKNTTLDDEIVSLLKKALENENN